MKIRGDGETCLVGADRLREPGLVVARCRGRMQKEVAIRRGQRLQAPEGTRAFLCVPASAFQRRLVAGSFRLARANALERGPPQLEGAPPTPLLSPPVPVQGSFLSSPCLSYFCSSSPSTLWDRTLDRPLFLFLAFAQPISRITRATADLGGTATGEYRDDRRILDSPIDLIVVRNRSDERKREREKRRKRKRKKRTEKRPRSRARRARWRVSLSGSPEIAKLHRRPTGFYLRTITTNTRVRAHTHIHTRETYTRSYEYDRDTTTTWSI